MTAFLELDSRDRAYENLIEISDRRTVLRPFAPELFRSGTIKQLLRKELTAVGSVEQATNILENYNLSTVLTLICNDVRVVAGSETSLISPRLASATLAVRLKELQNSFMRSAEYAVSIQALSPAVRARMGPILSVVAKSMKFFKGADVMSLCANHKLLELYKFTQRSSFADLILGLSISLGRYGSSETLMESRIEADRLYLFSIRAYRELLQDRRRLLSRVFALYCTMPGALARSPAGSITDRASLREHYSLALERCRLEISDVRLCLLFDTVKREDFRPPCIPFPIYFLSMV